MRSAQATSDYSISLADRLATIPVTTGGVIAMRNLDAQIEGLDNPLSPLKPNVEGRAALIGLLALRGHVRGCIADSEAAAALAERLVRDAPDDIQALVTRARTRCVFHLFSDALSDLALAQRLGMDASVVEDERAGIFASIGRYDEALEIRADAAARQPTFQSLGALAVLHAERQECDLAEQFFDDSRERYLGVSAFPLAALDFQRGHMWFAEGETRRARTWFVAASRRLPGYAPAEGHLAEVDAALGGVTSAIGRLSALAQSADDPDYAAQLSWLLQSLGRMEEARRWHALAAARYEVLVASHPAAFADHAAEFLLVGNSDPAKALHLATINFDIRKTNRARELLRRAASAGAVGVSGALWKR